MTTTMTPSATDLEAALARLRPSRPAEAALHLALPTTAPVGLSTRRNGNTWSWRGATAPANGPAGASLLASIGWQENDEYVDLQDDPIAWVKPTRTGQFTITFGSDLILDLPLLLLDEHAAPLWREALTDALEGTLAPGQDWRGFEVVASSTGWVVRQPR